MPFAPENKVHSRLSLEKMGRPDLQAVAKRNKVKAIGKSVEIIARLLDKQIAVEGSPAANGQRVTRASTRRSNKQVGSKTEPQPPIPHGGQPTVRSVQHDSVPRENRGRYREGTSLPGAPVLASAPEAAIVHMEQTDSDVRKVRRHLTALLENQVIEEARLDDANIVLEQCGAMIVELTDGVDTLMWTRIAIEEGVMHDLKDDRTLWDGTGSMNGKDKQRWTRFVNKYYCPPRQDPVAVYSEEGSNSAIVGSPPLADSDSSSSSYSDSDIEDMKNAIRGLVMGEEDADTDLESIYV